MRFEKVSFDEFKKCCGEMSEEEVRAIYDKIKLPRRATRGSAGYDFYCPYKIELTNTYTTIPTGVRWVVDNSDSNAVLIMLPRSGQGFKNGVRLRNTTGVIDQDYCNAANEGHIMAKLNAEENKTINQGEAFIQGIIIPYLVVENDEATNERVGGFGSTDNRNN